MNLFSLASVKETRKPIKPTDISVIRNPSRETTKISSFGTAKSVEKMTTAVNSLVPKPAKLIGIKLTALATGNNSRKYK